MPSDNTTRMSCVRWTEEIEGVNVTAYDGISFRNLSHSRVHPWKLCCIASSLYLQKLPREGRPLTTNFSDRNGFAKIKIAYASSKPKVFDY